MTEQMNEDYKDYVERQKLVYNDEELSSSNTKLTNLNLVYEQLVKDYQKRGQELALKDAVINQLNKEKDEAEKTLDDVIAHTNAKVQKYKEQIIEIPYTVIRNMFRFDDDPTYIYIALDENGNRLWMKSPYEYEVWGKKDGS